MGDDCEVAQGNRMVGRVGCCVLWTGGVEGWGGGHQEVGMWVPVCDVIVSRDVSAPSPPPPPAHHSSNNRQLAAYGALLVLGKYNSEHGPACMYMWNVCTTVN